MAQESRLVIVIDAKNAERNARNLGNELNSIERRGDFATKSMDGLSVATRQLAGYMAGVVTVGAAINRMDTYTGLQNRLKLVTSSQVELNQALKDTFNIAQATGQAWDSTAQVYQRFADNAKRLGITLQQTSSLTETVAKAISISGGSAASAEAALVQFGQALASGVLRGEEFNSIAEQAPGLLKAIAMGLDTNIGQLRGMAAEGKLTADVVVKSLEKAKVSVDDLFSKTDFTIGNSFTMLNNAITQFIGEAGKSSGAAQALSGSIQTLAGNLDTLISAMMIGGAYWLGTYIPAIYASGVAVAAKTKELAAQTVTQYAVIQAERAAAAQQVISTQAIVANTQATLTALAAEKALEVQRLKAQITEKGRTATITRMAELKKIEAQVTRELAVAEGALASAQARSAAAGAATVGIGSRLLGVLGGPVGIGITVASLAAGYLLMRDSTAEANKKLEQQAAVAKKAKEELLALKGLEKDSAINDMTTSFERQNKALAESSSKINIQLNAIALLYKGNKEIVQVVNDARDGTISMNDAVKRFNELRISKDIYSAIKENTSEFEKNAKEAKTTKESLKLLGIEVELSGKKAQTAVAGIDDNSKALTNNETAAQRAEKAQKAFRASLFDRDYEARITKGLLDKGYSPEQVKNMVETANWARKNGVTITNELYQIGLQTLAIEQRNNEVIDARNKSLKESTNELQKQQKVLSVNAKVQANAAKYGFGAIESKYNLPAGTLSAIHMIESRGNAKAYNKSTGATGGFQFLEGTAKQYGVKDRTDLAQSAEGAGKYMSYLLKLFKGDLEKAVRAYHAGEGNVQKGKGIGKYNNQYWKDFQGYVAGANGYTTGDITSKDFDKLIQDAAKMAEDQAKLRLQLENDVANEVTKIRNDLAKKLEDVDKANFTPERKAEIKTELQSRADNDVAIAQQALRTKLDDYRQFNLTEEQLLKESFDRKKFNAAHDIELSKDQRDEAIKYLDQQHQHELGLLKLAQEQRLFQAKQFLQSEMQSITQRYEREREEILTNSKLAIDERQKLINFSKTQEQLEKINKASGVVRTWENTSSEINGTTSFNQLDNERVDRTSQSLGVLDADLAFAENNEAREKAAQAHADRMFAIDADYQRKKLNLEMTYGEKITGSMVDMLAAAGDKQSAIYKAMFTANKAFAIAQSLISIQAGIAQAANNPFPYNLVGMATVAAETASIVGNIKAVADNGFADGGYTGNGLKHTPAGLVHKGEVVWSQDDIKRWGGVGAVESMRTSSPTANVISPQREMNQFQAINSNPSNGATVLEPIVNVYVMDGQTADVTRNDDGSMDIRIRQLAGDEAKRVFQQEIQNPNSGMSKAIKRNYNVAPRRP